MNKTFLDLETTACESDIPSINNAVSLQGMKENFIVRNTLKTWNQVRRHFGILNQTSTYLDVGFRTWKDAGVFKIQDLFLGEILKSFFTTQDGIPSPSSTMFLLFTI